MLSTSSPSGRNERREGTVARQARATLDGPNRLSWFTHGLSPCRVLISIDQFLQTIRSQNKKGTNEPRAHKLSATSSMRQRIRVRERGLPSMVKRPHAMEWRDLGTGLSSLFRPIEKGPVIRLLASPRDIWILTQLHVSVGPPGLAFRDFAGGQRPLKIKSAKLLGRKNHHVGSLVSCAWRYCPPPPPSTRLLEFNLSFLLLD